MSRILLVSNRLPITVTAANGQGVVTRSAGGLAGALRSVHEQEDSLWIGWPGGRPALPPQAVRQLDWQMAAMRVVPVPLSRPQVKGFYEDVSNGILWPVAHCLIDNLPLEMHGWEHYRAANERFADTVVEQYRDGDTIWVHDYHLMLLPTLLRERLPDARIGYFHHIPFPPAEVFRLLPWRADLLRGLLGADLIGFHTGAHVRNFKQAVEETVGLQSDRDDIHYLDRTIRARAFPIGIDAEEWRHLASTPAAIAEAERYAQGEAETSLLVGVDRLDYTKGILRRLLAFERVLEQEPPEFRDRLRLVQVTVPSREGVRVYAALKRRIDELVGRINGRFGTPHRMPVHRVHGHLQPHELAGLYRAADVFLATPLRDGMNLVAKEFVASQVADDGVLILSEFAGAAEQMSGALIVNPYDLDGMALSIRRALRMPRSERQARMAAMQAQVATSNVRRWAHTFLDSLATESGSTDFWTLDDVDGRGLEDLAIPI